MIRKAKWVDGVESQQPVGEVAREVLLARLEMVGHYLALAAQQPEEDVEYVHQLRVCARRAMAALEIFSSLLPKRKRRIAKRLRSIRRSAGPARDDDVLAMRLEKMASTSPDSGAGFLLEQAQTHRTEMQQPIVGECERSIRKGFDQDVAKLVAKLRWRDNGSEATFEEFARNNLPVALDPFLAVIDTDLSDSQGLHQLRIAGKKLRYAMEVFVVAFPAAFRKSLYPQVEKLQELLGTVNDHATAQVRFESELAATDHPQAIHALQMILAEEAAQLTRSQEEFARWWTPERIEQLRTSFAEMLAE